MRNLLSKIISNNSISIRKLRRYKIIFQSNQHLNLFFFKDYEKNIWDNLRDLLPPPPTGSIFLDIGANIGQSALILHSIFDNIKTISFEPSPNEFRYLQSNILLNNLNGVTINGLITDKVGYSKFYIDVLTGGRLSQISFSNEKESILVKSYSFTEQLKLYNPYLIKIDIEGFEAELFKSFDPFYFKNSNFIVEVRAESSESIIKIFLETHDIVLLETKDFIKFPMKIPFGNLLIKKKQD
jgi:FkbM family methyltransferase